MAENKVFKATEVEVLADLGLVVGKCIISTKAGEPYYDTQGDNIPLTVAAKAMCDFFADERVHKAMHRGQQVGTISGWMLISKGTCQILDLQADWEGIAIIMKPEPQIMKLYEEGTYRGFSIGGTCAYVEEPA